HAAGANDGVFADRDIAENRRARADRRTFADARFLDFPVGFRLQAAAGSRAGIDVVDESYAVADEDIVFNFDPFANEGVAGNLATIADAGVFLNFDESAYLCLVSDLASV